MPPLGKSGYPYVSGRAVVSNFVLQEIRSRVLWPAKRWLHPHIEQLKGYALPKTPEVPGALRAISGTRAAGAG